MNKNLLKIEPEYEINKIIAFLKDTFLKQKINKAVIGISGGIDSATSFALLKNAIKPHDIIVVHLYYFESQFAQMENFILNSGIPNSNIHHISIKESVDIAAKTLSDKESNTGIDTLRIGNIAARMRMIFLYDIAKEYNALVCGTENKSENLLGYFTRFGDQASDIEPISHLYKTQIIQIAKYLKIPDEIIDQKPSAGLWKGQTDEGQFGFTYEEADQVLYLYTEKAFTINEIEDKGYPNVDKIINWHKKNLFKQLTPYSLL